MKARLAVFKSVLQSIALLCCALCLTTRSHAQTLPPMEVVGLSDLSGIWFNDVTAISPDGHWAIVNAGAGVNGTVRIYVVDTSTGKSFFLGNTPDAFVSINNKGEVLGPMSGDFIQIYRNTGQQYVRSVLRLPDNFLHGLSRTGQPLRAEVLTATSINNQGAITGTALDQDRYTRAFVSWQGNTVEVRGEQNASTQTVDFINDRGDIYGRNSTPGVVSGIPPMLMQPTRAFFANAGGFGGGVMRGSPVFPDDALSKFTAASSNGAYDVGHVQRNASSSFPIGSQAFYRSPNGTQILPTPSGGYINLYSVNIYGFATGFENSPVGEAFIYNGTSRVSQQSLANGNTSWFFNWAAPFFIGDNGYIIGIGTRRFSGPPYTERAEVYIMRPGSKIDFADINEWADPEISNTSDISRIETYPQVVTAESTLNLSPAKLQDARSVIGAAADGSTRVLIRLQVPGPGVATFSLSDSAGSIETLGALGAPGSPPANLEVRNITSILGSDNKWYAYAMYRAPSNFERDLLDGQRIYREVKVSTTFNPTNGGVITSHKSLMLMRPPVVFVHGLASQASSWSYKFLSQDPRFVTYRAEYKGNNAGRFKDNVPVIHKSIKIALRKMRAGYGFAATKVTVVAHSMGGILSRLYAAGREGGYYRKDNLGQGDIYKLITLYTPFYGSGWACGVNQLVDPTKQGKQKLANVCLNCGAFEDLRPDSFEVRTMPAMSIPVHAVAGVGGDEAVTTIISASSEIISLKNEFFGHAIAAVLDIANDNYPYVLGAGAHDLVVSRTSALDNLPAASTSEVSYQGLTSLVGTHINAGAQEEVANDVVIPLLLTPVDAAEFAAGMAANADIAVPQICSSPPPAPETVPPQDGGFTALLSSTGTGAGTTFSAAGAASNSISVVPGATVNIEISSQGSFIPIRAYVSSEFGVVKITDFPKTVSFNVPSDAEGVYPVKIIGRDAAGRNSTSVVEIIVSSNRELVYLKVEPEESQLGCIDDTMQLTVSGLFTDDSQIDVGAANYGTLYTSDHPEIVAVDENGQLKALDFGSAIITVTHGNITRNVSTKVLAALCTKTPLATITLTTPATKQIYGGIISVTPVAAVSSDGAPVKVSLLEPPVGAVITPTGILLWTPPADQVGTQKILIKAKTVSSNPEVQILPLTLSFLPAKGTPPLTPTLLNVSLNNRGEYPAAYGAVVHWRDNSDDEDNFTHEVSRSSTGPFSVIYRLYPDKIRSASSKAFVDFFHRVCANNHFGKSCTQARNATTQARPKIHPTPTPSPVPRLTVVN